MVFPMLYLRDKILEVFWEVFFFNFELQVIPSHLCFAHLLVLQGVGMVMTARCTKYFMLVKSPFRHESMTEDL